MASPSFAVSSDTATNLIRIRLVGAVSAADMRACVAEVEKALPALRPQFRVLTDLSGIQTMDTDCVPEVKRLMDLCRGRGVGTVVRVVPEGSRDVGFNILSLFHYPRKVRILTHATADEAEQALAR